MKLRETVADLAETLELPGEALGVRVTLTARRRAVVEYHGGLRGYSGECVEVCDGPGRLRILGSGLTLLAMDRETLVVSGRISAVEYA
ncbi:MAG: YabP/YqfC family sporulation protein [Oscillospiraceae bacterium]|nr:YabP/YqfC family sporulation protein [Oscillospiraceae bacterium]